jgi:hypothetical protein
MSGPQTWTVTLQVGSRLSREGQLWTVVGMETGCVLLGGPRGSAKRVVTSTLFADPTTRLLGVEGTCPPPVGSALDELSDDERE